MSAKMKHEVNKLNANSRSVNRNNAYRLNSKSVLSNMLQKVLQQDLERLEVMNGNMPVVYSSKV